jgi:Cys/Met metabolism PLP-dependent enzyme
VAGDDIYGGTSRLLAGVLPGMGIDVTNVDHTDLDATAAAFIPGRTKLALLESPTNPRMQARRPAAALPALRRAALAQWSGAPLGGPLATACHSVLLIVTQRPHGASCLALSGARTDTARTQCGRLAA